MMKRPNCWMAVPFGAVCLALVAAAWGDTLELKDQRVITGKYLGGTQSHVRFLVSGKIELYPVSEILAITFGGEAQPAGENKATPRRPAGSAAAAAPRSVTVPAGTRLVVRMIDSVDSEKNKVGDKFRASLEENLIVNDTVVVPKGTDVYGRLAEAKEAGTFTGKSELKLELTDILIQQQLQPIVTGDYDVAGKSRGASTAKKVGGGAAIGAVIGAIAGGGKGAAIGAGVGAGAGTAVQIFTRGERVQVPSETLLDFRLEQPFTVRLSPPTGQ